MDKTKIICRVCLTEIKEGYPLFDTYEEQMTLASILNGFIADEDNLVSQSDGFPELLCETCTETLVQFYNFMVIYKTSAEKLREDETKLNIKLIEDEPVDDIERQLQQFEDNLEEEEEENNQIDDTIYIEETIESSPPIIKKVDVGLEKTEIAAANKDVIVKIECEKNIKFEDKWDTSIPYPVNPNIFTCKICTKKFKNKTQYLGHKRRCKHVTKSTTKLCICHLCGKTCAKEADLKDHMDSHSTESNYPCKHCNKKLKGRTSLIRHLKAHANHHQYMCELCGRKFTHISTLRTHNNLIHKAEKNFHCLLCDMSFTLKATLQRHVRRHKQRENDNLHSKKYYCHDCDMKYLDKSSLSRHIQAKHGKTDEEAFKCDMCDRVFTNKQNMLRHKDTSHINLVVIKGVKYEVVS